MKNNKGITLIALIITIIVMLILAGISLTFTIGDEGVISKAENAKEEKRAAEVAEIIDVWNAAKQVDILGNNGKRTTKTFNEQVDELVNNKLLSEKEAEIVRNHGIIKIGSRLITILDGAPKLQSDMKAVYWDDNNNEITSDDKNFDIEKYYSYTEKRWANAKTSDGSYWVWIPRYAYCITDGYHSSHAGNIDIKFLDRYNCYIEDNENGKEEKTPEDGMLKINVNEIDYINVTNGQSQQQYLVHPAFTRNADNGGGFGEITGIWVAKFKMSGENSNNGNIWNEISYYSAASGNKLTTNAGNDEERIRIVSKPGKKNWDNIDIVKAYLNSKNYDINKKSHLIKNSEWGAIAYLSYSKYGINYGEERNAIKEVDSIYAGGGIEDTFKEKLDTTTTFNIYGVYDMNNGYDWEYTASYFSFVNSLEFYEDAKVYVEDGGKDSTAYKTVYEIKEEKKGDAIMEISDLNDSICQVWINHRACLGNKSALDNENCQPFFLRGSSPGNTGYARQGGILFSGDTDLNPEGTRSFRVCLVVD